MPEPMEILSGTIGTNSPDRVVPATGIFWWDKLRLEINSESQSTLL